MLEVCVAIILTVRVPFCGRWEQNLEKKGKKPGMKYLCFWIANSGWSWSVKQAEAQTSQHVSATYYFLQMSKKILELENQPLSFTVRDILHGSKSLACIIVAELSMAAVGPSADELWPLLLTPETAQQEALNFSDSPWSCSNSSPEPFVPWQDLL